MVEACANKPDFCWKIWGRRMIPETVNYNNEYNKPTPFDATKFADVILLTAKKLSTYS